MSERIAELLKTAIGLDAESTGRAAIDSAVRHRASACGCPGEAEYWSALHGSPGERQALIDAVIVPETWFFRYPQSFRALARLAGDAVRKVGGQRPVRILSLPCSTGEEPFSAVMALLDAAIPAHCFEVDGLDISARALETARLGLYRANSFRGADRGFRDRYFTADDGGYRMTPAVAGKVRFGLGNLLDPTLSNQGAVYDFVFCRNLLIYFDAATQARSARTLLRLLREDGVLFAGPAEANLLSSTGLQALGYPQAFVFRRRSDEAGGRSSGPPPASVAPMPPAAPVRPLAAPPPRRPATARVDPPSAPDRSARQAAIAVMTALADGGRHAEAKTACEAYLARYGADTEAFYLLGLLSDAAGHVDAAEAFYRKALYLDPGHAAARVHMSAHRSARSALRASGGRRPPRGNDG